MYSLTDLKEALEKACEELEAVDAIRGVLAIRDDIEPAGEALLKEVGDLVEKCRDLADDIEDSVGFVSVRNIPKPPKLLRQLVEENVRIAAGGAV